MENKFFTTELHGEWHGVSRSNSVPFRENNSVQLRGKKNYDF